MFPKERHAKIVKRLDDLEADLFRVYRSIERLRLDLQREWRVLPSDGEWSEEASERTRYSALPPADDAVARTARDST